MDLPQCEHLVAQYLLGQDWQLADPQALARAIWEDLTRQKRPPAHPVAFVRLQTAFYYAAVLHEALCAPPGERHDRAWDEVKAWLFKNIGRITADPLDQEEVVQETLIELHKRLPAHPLKAPRALWTFLLKTMRNRRTSLHRQESAIKRGGNALRSLEDLNDQEHLPAPPAETPDPETNVTEQDLHQRLRAFFQKHLPTDLQRQVAEACFIEGHSPMDVAALLGKQPHEVRLVKTRIVQTLRSLPPEARRELYSLLRNLPPDEETGHE